MITQEIGLYSYHQDIKINTVNENGRLIVGKFCSIADNLELFFDVNHRIDWLTTYPFGHIHKDIFTNFNGDGHPISNGDIIIGNDVWIGKNVTIMSGITIGDGAVVAANSHIVKDVEPYTIVGGNPVNFIKYRFNKELIDTLLFIKWWNWDDEKINKVLKLLCSPPIDDICNFLLDIHNEKCYI